MTSRINTLNALEQAEAEEAAGLPIYTIEDKDRKTLRVRIYGAIGWVITKRDEPTLTLVDYMKRHTFAEILDFVLDDPAEEAGDADPFPGEAAAADEGGATDAEGPVLPGDGDQPG